MPLTPSHHVCLLSCLHLPTMVDQPRRGSHQASPINDFPDNFWIEREKNNTSWVSHNVLVTNSNYMPILTHLTTPIFLEYIPFFPSISLHLASATCHQNSPSWYKHSLTPKSLSLSLWLLLLSLFSRQLFLCLSLKHWFICHRIVVGETEKWSCQWTWLTKGFGFHWTRVGLTENKLSIFATWVTMGK